MPDAGNDENVAAFANRTDDDAVLEKLDSEEKMLERIAKTKAKGKRA